MSDSPAPSETAPATPKRLLGSTLFVSLGYASSQVLNFAAILMITRALGPKGYGVVAIATTLFMLGWQVIGRGWDQALVRTVSENRYQSPDTGWANAQTIHSFKWLGGLLLIIVFALFARPLTDIFAGADISAGPVVLAGATALAASLSTYTISCLQASDSFRGVGLVQMSTALGRVIPTAILWYYGVLTPSVAMSATAAGFIFGAFLGYGITDQRFRQVTALGPRLSSMFTYSRWLILSSLIYLFYTRLDQLVLGALSTPDVVGIYAAAMAFMAVVDQLSNSLLMVLLPRICRADGLAALRSEVKSGAKLAGILALLLVPGIFIAPILIGWILGPEYKLAPVLFTIVYPGAVFNIITHPMQAVMHARGKTLNLLALDISVLVLNLGGNLCAIPLYGMYGAAYVALGTRLIAGIGLVTLVFRELRIDPAKESDPMRAPDSRTNTTPPTETAASTDSINNTTPHE